MCNNLQHCFNSSLSFFWSEILSGHIAGKNEIIKNEIENRKLQINEEQDYNLIVSKITEIKKDREK